LLICLLLLTTLPIGSAFGEPQELSWDEQRLAAYNTWQAANPKATAAIATFVNRAMNQSNEIVPQSHGASYEDLAARSRALTPAQRRDALALFKTAFDLQQTDDTPGAEENFKHGLEIDPGNGLADYYYASLLLDRGDKVGAAEYFRRAAELAEGTAEADKAAVALRQLPTARYGVLASRSRSLAPPQRRQAQDLLKTAFDLAKVDNFDAAEAAFRQGLQIDPGNGLGNYYYASLLMILGDRPRAAEYFRRAVELAPGTDESIQATAVLGGLPDTPYPPALWKPGQPLLTLWDGPAFPEMVVVPTQAYLMGSTPEETTREQVSDTEASRERPQHQVEFDRPFAIAKYPVTRGEFATFVRETGHNAEGCRVWDGKSFVLQPSLNWRNPGFAQTDGDPAVCVSFADAQAYVAWLNDKFSTSVRPYKLPSEAEWEYAARAGTTTARWWGNAIGQGNANCASCGSRWDHSATSPVRSFPPNAFGLYDMLGNVWQWTQDCWHNNYDGAPADGSPWNGICFGRILRGGAWLFGPADIRAAKRLGDGVDDRNNTNGFRVARTLP
jgi:formylglycine-generating enzyme required for sulfatase activity